MLHVAVILTIWFFMFEQSVSLLNGAEKIFSSVKFWKIAVAYILVLKPTSIVLSLFFKRWSSFKFKRSQSLKDAGGWIGYIERVLILTFIITNNITAIGFLLAAKSVFRFGDLNGSKNVKKTEYVLIGTLASFSIATIIGLVVTL